MNKIKPEKIGTIFENIVINNGYGDILLEKKLQENWKNIVGEKLSLVCEIDNYENGILIIKVKSSSWRNELQFLTKEIMSNIKKNSDFKGVKRIILV